MSEWLTSRRCPCDPGNQGADSLRLCQPRPHRRAARPRGSAAQPLPRRRRGDARRPPGAGTENFRHRGQRPAVGRTGDYDGHFDRAARRPRLSGRERRRVGAIRDARGDGRAALAGRKDDAVPGVGRALCEFVRGPGGAGERELSDARAERGQPASRRRGRDRRLAASLGATDGDEPIHIRLGRAWSLGPAGVERVRWALVLIADHELNASAFAARIAASTGASVAAGLLAGLCALSGPRHGGAGRALAALMEEAEMSNARSAVAGWLARGHELPGFGHPLYLDGDSRAAALLDGLAIDETTVALKQGRTRGDRRPAQRRFRPRGLRAREQTAGRRALFPVPAWPQRRMGGPYRRAGRDRGAHLPPRPLRGAGVKGVALRPAGGSRPDARPQRSGTLASSRQRRPRHRRPQVAPSRGSPPAREPLPQDRKSGRSRIRQRRFSKGRASMAQDTQLA